VALKYADRATVLENGVSVLEGSAADLRQRTDIKTYYLGGAPLPPQHFPKETAA
ncbi:MAG: ABC transporter ATP-binding protein, partial [Mesorhizobium sp.]